MITKIKKDASYTVRLESQIAQIIQDLADQDERTISWMLRKLILEALKARKLLKKSTNTG